MKQASSLRCALALVSAAGLFSVTQAQAQIIASDNFNSYSLGTLSSQTGAGTGFTGNWTAPQTGFGNVVSPGLGGGNGLQTSQNNVSSSSIMAARQFAAPITGQNVYVSFLWQYPSGPGFGSTGTDSSTFALALSDTATDTANPLDFGMRATGGTQTFMARQGTGTPPTGGQLTLAPGTVGNPSQTYLLVAQYVWNGSAYNTINAWFNPGLGSSQTTPNVTATTTSNLLTSLSYVYFREGAPATNSVYNADNLVIGNTWNDVVPVPEPASAVLGALGLGALVIFRRRGPRSS